MQKLVIVGIVAAVAAAVQHPVNENLVNEIKNKAATWTPMEVDENPLSSVEADHLYKLLGAPFDKEQELAGLEIAEVDEDY